MSSEDADADENTDIRADAKMQKKREIDQLSLELLSNSSHYKKYLAKSDPAESTGNSARLFKNKERVQTMLTDLLDDYDGLTTFSMTGNGEIQRKFKACVDKILDFLEWTNYKNSPEHNAAYADTMFDPRLDTIFEPRFESRAESRSESIPATKSFWGKKVNKYS